MALLEELALLQWPPPHLIPELDEPHVEEVEALRTLDICSMKRLPPIDAREFALPFRITQGLVENSELYVEAPEDTRHWEDCEGLEYAGVRDHYEWSLVEPEDDHLEDETPVESNETPEAAGEIREAPELRLAATKRPHPITNDDTVLLQGINREAPHIATFGLQDAIVPSFGPILEPRPHH